MPWREKGKFVSGTIEQISSVYREFARIPMNVPRNSGQFFRYMKSALESVSRYLEIAAESAPGQTPSQ
jgi:hypothetical protein